MKKRRILISLVTGVVMIFSMCLYGCSSDGGGSDEASAPEKHLLGYPDGYDPLESGASSYDGWCDNPDTKYFAINDYYNMESEGTLHILNNFETYQQSTEYTCGPSSAYMVLNWFDGDIDKYDEMTIADMSETSSTVGVGPDGIEKFFSEIGWYTEKYANDEAGAFDNEEDPLAAFEEFCIKNIDNGVPIMVDWIDWDGHWQVIVGIDTCGEDNPSDDVLILADPYDTSDHWQDGYYTYSAERFFYTWHEGACTGKSNPYINPYVIAMPQEKAKELKLK